MLDILVFILLGHFYLFGILILQCVYDNIIIDLLTFYFMLTSFVGIIYGAFLASGVIILSKPKGIYFWLYLIYYNLLFCYSSAFIMPIVLPIDLLRDNNERIFIFF